MAKYFIANRSVVGVVTINKEALDFKNRGFAQTDNDETYEAAKRLKTLGYEPYTEEEFKEKFSDSYTAFVSADDIKRETVLVEQVSDNEIEEIQAEVDSVYDDVEIESAKTDKKEEDFFDVPQSREGKAKLTRSIKAKLADAKRKWDSSEDEEEKAKLKIKIETFENRLKQLQ